MASNRLAACALLGLALFCAAPTTARAQEAAEPRYANVVSANPFGLLLEFFNAEYERVISTTSSVGVGGSFISLEDEDYLNADVFWRYYPSGTPLDGWALGVKVGLTRSDLVADAEDNEETYLGFGFDANWSWLMGANDNFYVGLGFGLKRLVGANADDADIALIPTIRVVNIGFAF